MTLRQQLWSSLQRWFSKIHVKPEYMAVTVLDPRFKLVPFGTIQQAANPELRPVKTVLVQDAWYTLLELLRSVQRQTTNISSTATVTTDAVEHDQKPRNKSIFATFTYSSTAAGTADSSEDSRYLVMPVVPHADPTDYWLSAQKDFRNMAMWARRYVTCLLYTSDAADE